MVFYEIPLSSNNQKFNIQLGGTYYKLRFIYRINTWFVDVLDTSGTGLILGLPMRKGINLLEQHQHIIRGALYAVNENVDEVQGFEDLGNKLRLYWEDI